ncbi:MAG TPA: acetolactate synthase small subunit [Gemmatimonadales bacterium]|jgi:acetolactate synthase-1/3 small subunit|nr:acetolactate synthase small subunit [Gemmatimonadales bacterium]
MASWVVSVLLEDDLLALNRAIGIIRRRQLPVESFRAGPAAAPGVTSLTLVLGADRGAVDRLAAQLRKMVGVREVTVGAEEAVAVRELLLARVAVERGREAALLDVLALYQAGLVAEAAGEAVVEATGSPPLLTSLLRALEPFGVLDSARSGPLAVTRDHTAPTPSPGRPDRLQPSLAAAHA